MSSSLVRWKNALVTGLVECAVGGAGLFVTGRRAVAVAFFVFPLVLMLLGFVLDYPQLTIYGGGAMGLFSFAFLPWAGTLAVLGITGVLWTNLLLNLPIKLYLCYLAAKAGYFAPEGRITTRRLATVTGIWLVLSLLHPLAFFGIYDLSVVRTGGTWLGPGDVVLGFRNIALWRRVPYLPLPRLRPGLPVMLRGGRVVRLIHPGPAQVVAYSEDDGLSMVIDGVPLPKRPFGELCTAISHDGFQRCHYVREGQWYAAYPTPYSCHDFASLSVPSGKWLALADWRPCGTEPLVVGEGDIVSFPKMVLISRLSRYVTLESIEERLSPPPWNGD